MIGIALSVIDMDFDVVLLFVCPLIIFLCLLTIVVMAPNGPSLTEQAIEHCPNGWDVNKYCTEGVYNYSCRDDGKNYTYMC